MKTNHIFIFCLGLIYGFYLDKYSTINYHAYEPLKIKETTKLKRGQYLIQFEFGELGKNYIIEHNFVIARLSVDTINGYNMVQFGLPQKVYNFINRGFKDENMHRSFKLTVPKS